LNISFSGEIYCLLKIGINFSLEDVLFEPKSSSNLCKGTGL